jgi:transcriptional regulator with XRE-family HTH domain
MRTAIGTVYTRAMGTPRGRANERAAQRANGTACVNVAVSGAEETRSAGHNIDMATEGEAASGPEDPWQPKQDTLGSFIRMQRQLARLSLREMAAMTAVSNAYLSQVERGLHQPSLKVMRSIADALGIPAADLLRQAGITTPEAAKAATAEESNEPGHPDTERAIRTDPRLTQAQREALLGVYRSFLAED